MIATLKKIWEYLFGKVKTLFITVLDFCIAETKELIADKQLMALALDAVKAAAEEKLTGNKAFVAARKKFVNAAKEAGIQLKDSTINLVLELVYNGFKKATSEIAEKVDEQP